MEKTLHMREVGLLKYLSAIDEPYIYLRTPRGYEYLGIGITAVQAPVSKAITFLTRGFRDEATRWWAPRILARKIGTDVWVLPNGASLPKVKDASRLRSPRATSVDDDRAYVERVESTLQSIEAGGVQKVVIARRELMTQELPFSAMGSLKNLIARFPTCTTFSVRLSNEVFIGATPEVLVRTQGTNVYADALAGSAPRSSSTKQDTRHGRALMGNPKERAEHAWVVEMIADTLSGFAEDVVVPHDPKIKRLSNVQHLHTAISGRLRAATAFGDLVDALHPTPAVGGWPRDEACALIDALEPFDRELYAGVVGLVDDDRDEAIASVAIRSAKLQDNKAWIYAGAGIVSGSEPKHEAKETRLKLNAIREALV